MPNHLTNKLTIQAKGDELKKIKETILSKDEKGKLCFDFDRLIPMPKILDRTSPFRAETAEEKAMNKKQWEAYRQSLIKKFGADTWYDWRLTHWGTKWNSYDNQIYDNILMFLTAWSPPKPVIQKLSELFPKTKFDLHYIDEGWNFAGQSIYQNGVLIEEHPIECDRENEEFCQLYEEMIGEMPDEE